MIVLVIAVYFLLHALSRNVEKVKSLYFNLFITSSVCIEAYQNLFGYK